MNQSSHPSGIIRRDGQVAEWQPEKIRVAIAKAFLRDATGELRHHNRVELTAADRDQVDQIYLSTLKSLSRHSQAPVHIESVQDTVELALMRIGAHEVARDFVLYRQARNNGRYATSTDHTQPTINTMTVRGEIVPFDFKALTDEVNDASLTLGACIETVAIVNDAFRNMFEGIPEEKILDTVIMAATSRIEREPSHSYFAARLHLSSLRRQVFGARLVQADMNHMYVSALSKSISTGIAAELLDEKLALFDLDLLGNSLVADRDLLLDYQGIKTLSDRYFQHIEEVPFELPQTFFMRVAMGIAINEKDRNERAIEFYNVLSTFDYMSATPTLFNAGTCHPQLSSCYLTTTPDNLDGIFDSVKDNALLSKWAGGLGNDWTPVRALGSRIKGTNGKSQGVVPFLKVINDTAVAVNQGGKRKGAACAYLESWHLDIEEFLELRKNVGDDRRRTHDMNTANWIPDLFMKRVMNKGDWTLFSPNECPDLHEIYGLEFEAAYSGYEQKAARGEMKQFRTMPALTLWRKMMSMLFETGHPWITFKDPCNIRSPQSHVGVVHSSNLCTEITLNTSADEIAVCNLGSVNMAQHINEYGLDKVKLAQTIKTAMRMLDNVIDINYYPVQKAKNANLRHRPVGLGLMGFQDALHQMRIPYASTEAVEFADQSMEYFCYHAYLASSELAEERGKYETFNGSLWSTGILPFDSLELLEKERGTEYLSGDRSMTMDWDTLRARIVSKGMRNSNCVAIAPTATISNIVGVTQSIEPSYTMLFAKSNLSGEFTIPNSYLVNDLKACGLWDDVMIADLKFYDGAIGKIDRIPANLKALYATAFEVEAEWLIEAASRRQKWIDQGQSLNLYLANPSGNVLSSMYQLAWVKGLKTTYYLRTIAASAVEKSTGRGGELNAVSSSIDSPVFCSIDNPECEACS